MLFYQVRLEHQCLNFVIYNDKLEIGDHADELPRLWVVIATRVEIGPHAIAKILCLTDIDDLARRIFVDIDAGVGRQGLELFGNGHTIILT